MEKKTYNRHTHIREKYLRDAISNRIKGTIIKNEYSVCTLCFEEVEVVVEKKRKFAWYANVCNACRQRISRYWLVHNQNQAAHKIIRKEKFNAKEKRNANMTKIEEDREDREKKPCSLERKRRKNVIRTENC